MDPGLDPIERDTLSGGLELVTATGLQAGGNFSEEVRLSGVT